MSETSITIGLKYKEDTFENAKLNYKWINSCIEKMQINAEEITFGYHFSYGRYQNWGNDYEKFIEEAFDKTDFSLVDMSWYCSGLFVIASYRGVSISSRDKILVHDLVDLLEKLAEKEIKETNIYNAPVVTGDGNIVTTGDGNIVTTGDGNIVTTGDRNIVATENANVINGNDNHSISNVENITELNNKKNGIKAFFRNMLNSAWGNIIWILFTFLAMCVLTYFGFIK